MHAEVRAKDRLLKNLHINMQQADESLLRSLCLQANVLKTCPCAFLTGDDGGHQTETGQGCERKREVEQFLLMLMCERWLKI